MNHLRPRIHFTPRQNWLNDPNGLVFVAGVYYLFFQYNPFAHNHGYLSWGHATSPDLLHWTEREVAIPWREGNDIFSGSAFVDWHNSGGFGQPGEPHPPLVAMYTGAGHYWQAQYLPYSRDLGQSWTALDDKPVLDEGKQDFRDPKAFWHAPTQRWVSVVVHPNERQIGIYGSADLHHWELLSLFGPSGEVGGIWEVPDLFPLLHEGKEHCVMKVDVFAGGPQGGTGAQYWVGQFDGVTFTPTQPAKWADFGKDFYAAITFSDVPERRIWLAWMNSWDYANKLPTSPWRGAMTLPRELGLRRGPDGELWPTQILVQEFQQLRDKPLTLDSDTAIEPSTPLEVNITLAKTAGFELTLFSAAGQEARLSVNGTQLTLERPANDVEGFGGLHTAKLPAVTGQLDLQVILDAGSLEIFACGGLLSLTDLLLPQAPITRLGWQISGNVACEAWTLRAAMSHSQT